MSKLKKFLDLVEGEEETPTPANSIWEELVLELERMGIKSKVVNEKIEITEIFGGDGEGT